MGLGTGSSDLTKPTRLKLKLHEIKEIIRTDHNEPCVAIDAQFYIIRSYMAVWIARALGSGVTSFEQIIISAIEKCCSIERDLTAKGFRTIWCLDGEKSINKLATARRREQRMRGQHEMMSMYLIIAKSKTGKELVSFENTYTLIKQHIPADFVPLPMEQASLVEIESKLQTKFKNGGFMPPDLTKRVIAGMLAKISTTRFMRVDEISEGEKLASILSHLGVAQAVMTDDSDALVLGARYTISNIYNNGKTPGTETEYYLGSYSRVVRSNNITHKQLMMFAILLGNDFNTKVPREGIVTTTANVMSKDFDITQHNIKHLGCLNIGICLSEFTVSKEEYAAVLGAVEKLE
jgi:hypothetical protein